MALPLGLAAGTALAGGIGAGQGYWHFAPNGETMSEADALAKVTSNATLEATAKQELESLKEKKADEIIQSEKSYQNIIDAYKPDHAKSPTRSDQEIRKTLLDSVDSVTDRKEYLQKELKNFKDLTAEVRQLVKKEELLLENYIKHLEAYEKLDLKDTPTVQKLIQGSLKTATQQVDGFMKWGYAEAKDLEKIGGEELVKHANASKIALGVGALAVGLGTGALTYLLINKPKTSASSSAE